MKDFWEQSSFFFVAPLEFDEKAVTKSWKENTSALLSEAKDILIHIESFTSGIIHDHLQAFVEKKEIGFGPIMVPLRIALVGSSKGPDLMQIIEMLGKEEVIKRIDFALNKIKA